MRPHELVLETQVVYKHMYFRVQAVRLGGQLLSANKHQVTASTLTKPSQSLPESESLCAPLAKTDMTALTLRTKLVQINDVRFPTRPSLARFRK